MPSHSATLTIDDTPVLVHYCFLTEDDAGYIDSPTRFSNLVIVDAIPDIYEDDHVAHHLLSHLAEQSEVQNGHEPDYTD